MVRIGVDLVPLLPHGENGGSSVLTLELLRLLPELSPDWEWVLFTTQAGASAARGLCAPNVTHLVVDVPRPAPGAPGRRRGVLRHAKRFLPGRLRDDLRIRLRERTRQQTAPFLASRQARLDLAFSPFGTTLLMGTDIPFVVVVHDLLYEVHPEFLPPLLVDQRTIEMEEIVRGARRIICISEFGRRSLLEATGVRPDRVRVVHNLVPRRHAPPDPGIVDEVLAHDALRPQGYFFYPANSWPHKNHVRLLEAFAIHRRSHPGSATKLVLVGADTGSGPDIGAAISRLGLEEDVVRHGYVSDAEVAVFLSNALALVFPSLYEGFGLPILEAMAVGTPVACSREASLPEIAGDAAAYFDPRSVPDIARTLADLDSMKGPARQTAVEQGFRRFRQHASAEALARQYVDVLAGSLLPARTSRTATDPARATPEGPSPNRPAPALSSKG